LSEVERGAEPPPSLDGGPFSREAHDARTRGCSRVEDGDQFAPRRCMRRDSWCSLALLANGVVCPRPRCVLGHVVFAGIFFFILVFFFSILYWSNANACGVTGEGSASVLYASRECVVNPLCDNPLIYVRISLRRTGLGEGEEAFCVTTVRSDVLVRITTTAVELAHILTTHSAIIYVVSSS